MLVLRLSIRNVAILMQEFCMLSTTLKPTDRFEYICAKLNFKILRFNFKSPKIQKGGVCLN